MTKHKQSKRLTCRKKYKIIRKVKEHNRKQRKEEKNAVNRKFKPKDPGIPNLFPFKEQILKQIEEKKQKEEELKQKNKERKLKDPSRKRKLQDLQKDAEKRAKEYAKRQAIESDLTDLTTGRVEFSRKAYYKEFKKVIEASDVVIEVLDARDPMGCRCPQIEELVMASGKNKKLVLLLNKVDLIPKDVAEKWLKYLRNEFPAVAFKASTQNQRQKLAQSKVPIALASNDLLQTSSCVGASTLLKLLGNYCRSSDIKTAITVGIVGFPNVGKSSVINSLKRSKACNVGSTPGVTKNMQEIQLDRHVKLLDCPGIVMATGSTDTQTILRNAVKVESIIDPVQPVEAILNRCNKMQVMQKYCVADYSNASEFLSLFAKRLGKLKKGGVPDQLAAAKVLLQDWNGGRITFYTHPPERSLGEEAKASVVQYWGAGFDIKALEREEKDDLNGLLQAMESALVLDPSKPIDMDDDLQDADADDEESIEAVDYDEEDISSENEMEDDKENEDEPPVKKVEPIVSMKIKKKVKLNVKEGKKTKVSQQLPQPDEEDVNMRVNQDKKKAFKNRQREERRKKREKIKQNTDEDDSYDFDKMV